MVVSLPISLSAASPLFFFGTKLQTKHADYRAHSSNSIFLQLRHRRSRSDIAGGSPTLLACTTPTHFSTFGFCTSAASRKWWRNFYDFLRFWEVGEEGKDDGEDQEENAIAGGSPRELLLWYPNLSLSPLSRWILLLLLCFCIGFQIELPNWLFDWN